MLHAECSPLGCVTAPTSVEAQRRPESLSRSPGGAASVAGGVRHSPLPLLASWVRLGPRHRHTPHPHRQRRVWRAPRLGDMRRGLPAPFFGGLRRMRSPEAPPRSPRPHWDPVLCGRPGAGSAAPLIERGGGGVEGPSQCPGVSPAASAPRPLPLLFAVFRQQ